MTPYGDRLRAGHYEGATATAEPEILQAPEPIPDEADLAYACPECDRRFSTEHALKVHTGKVHA